MNLDAWRRFTHIAVFQFSGLFLALTEASGTDVIFCRWISNNLTLIDTSKIYAVHYERIIIVIITTTTILLIE